MLLAWTLTCPEPTRPHRTCADASSTNTPPSRGYRTCSQFAGLGIAHLRSPSSVHPDPSSSYSLEMWAEQRRRCCELRPMEVRMHGWGLMGLLGPGPGWGEDSCVKLALGGGSMYAHR